MFIVKLGKTAAARRRVPIHSGLTGLVDRRTRDRAPDDYLFHELRAQGSERTDPIGKAFARHRRSLGIQEGTGRRSTVNFHSLRRWFITTAINAAQPPHLVSLVVGHQEGRKGMTLGRYWSGADDPALRAVVEAVRLPSPSRSPWLASRGSAPRRRQSKPSVGATVDRFVTEARVAASVDRKTANRKISAASAYWRWLVKRAGYTDNPWQGQSLSKAPIAHEDARNKRPFTDAEMAILLSGPADPELADAILVGALTGMRIEETYRLTVGDCANGWFTVRRSKTRAGLRRVPIHSDLPSLSRGVPPGRRQRPFCSTSLAPNAQRGRDQWPSRSGSGIPQADED